MAQDIRPSLTDFSPSEFDRIKELPTARPFHPGVVRRWVLQRGVRGVEEMSDLPRSLRTQIAETYDVRRTRLALVSESEDGTAKLLLELRDGQMIETVIIPDNERLTLCVSTQAGCGVRCVFCASGMSGLIRNLTPGEIVEQFLEARTYVKGQNRSITNMVLMGGGEPLNNFDNVKTALESLNHPDGAGFGARRITVSTIGIPARIDRLEELGKQVNLAISLHAPDEELRGQLIPGLDRIPLKDVLAAADRFFKRTGREITFEYVVLGGINDSTDHARKLADLLGQIRGKVNLIPFNTVADLDYQRPTDEAVDVMRKVLLSRGIKTTVRRSRGRDIDAACGQLRRRHASGQSLDEQAPESIA